MISLLDDNYEHRFIVDIRPGSWEEIHIEVDNLIQAIRILRDEYKWEGVIINTKTNSIYTRQAIEKLHIS